MTTKAEFDSFVAGFKLAGHEHVSMEQLDAILAMVPSVIASEVGSAAPAPVPTPDPVVAEAAPAPLPVQPDPVMPDPTVDPATVDLAGA